MRRRLLRAGVAAGTLLLPVPWARVWAQSEGAVKLQRASRIALVVGNGAYRTGSPLKNPVNDARAVADVLRGSGFAVTLVEDAKRQEMLDAIGAYASTLAAKRSVGLFYFAGHGLQLQWQNYLLPVDASVQSAADVPAQCVGVSTLMGGIRNAANPMNVIILDACRDNPFGRGAGTEQKGLSQMDAPTGTLLAYATAPGNAADDGAGANGLYTEHLLREMRVREAKIEDVFKRVRLAVRRASGGRQIPWESTSLEEDFYFDPPAQLRKLSEEEEEREFREELETFERARQANGAAPLEAYLRRYPSGRFAELAQLQLDRTLAAQGERPVEIASSKGNPFTAGTVRADTRFRVGDRWTYDEIDRSLFGNKPARFTAEVTAISDTQVIINGGEAIRDLLGNQIRFRDGRVLTPRQDQPLEFVVGKKWSTQFSASRGGKPLGVTRADFRVAGRETITVPAGTFDCFRIEANGVTRLRGSPDLETIATRWCAPDRVRLAVATEEIRRRVLGGHVDTRYSRRLELVAFEQR